MYIPNDLAPGACTSRVVLNGSPARRVALHTIQFTVQGMVLIGQGMLALADRHGLPVQLLRDRMKYSLFTVPPSESLYFLFHVPELDADMHVEIPAVHWRFVV